VSAAEHRDIVAYAGVVQQGARELAVSDQPLAYRLVVPTVRRRLLAATRPGHRDLPAVRAAIAP
jgi:hypothetical protein